MLRNLWPLRRILKKDCFIKRCVSIEIPDLEAERKLRLENFDEYFSELKLPYRMRLNPVESKEYVKFRVEEQQNSFSPLTVEQYSSIYENISSPEKKQEVIKDIKMLVVYYNRIIGGSIFSPKTIPIEDMEKMLFKYKHPSERIRYIHFITIREFDQWRKDIEKEKRRQIRQEENLKELENFREVGCFNSENELQYGYWRNTLFPRYYSQAISRYSLHSLRQAEMFGQPLVVDCSFDETMADYETISVGRQLTSIHHDNRYSREPFKLLFTGYNPNNRGFRYISKNFTAILDNPEYCVNFFPQSYQELCPNERLIYLSPDSREVMKEFDHNAVYIIGALVSKTHKSQLTFDKARSEGIETYRLPIHEYVKLKPNVKRVLSIVGVFRILLHLKQHGDWEAALRQGIQSHKLIDGQTTKVI